MKARTIFYIVLGVFLTCAGVVWYIGSPFTYTRYNSIIGCTSDKVIEEYGVPRHSQVFNLSEFQRYEYRSGVVEKLGLPKGYNRDSVRIMEMEWKYRYHTFVIWLRENNNNWIVFDNLKWSDNIEF